MKILVLNSGSSSIKFKFFDMQTKKPIASGHIEEIGSSHAGAKIETSCGKKIEEKLEIKDHNEGIDVMNDLLKKTGTLNSLDEIDGVGHRIVQGADYFDRAVLVDESVMAKIEELIPLAPLHNPANLSGIKSSLAHKSDLPNVAVFDTVFHQTMPEYAYMYALPYEFYTDYKVRRYGAHGTSHGYVSKKAAEFLGKKAEEFNCITLHLGNGSSISAIKNGKCIDTSMGLTPLEGLMMGTRCGNIDPAIIPYMNRVAGYSTDDMDNIMNKKSGFLGVCGTNDLRKVGEKIQNGDERAKLARDMFIYMIVKFIGSYYAAIGKIDAIVFTAGIGENSAEIRKEVCEKLAHFGILIDEDKNLSRSKEIRDISHAGSKIKTLIIPTDEELAIAEATYEIVKNL